MKPSQRSLEILYKHILPPFRNPASVAPEISRNSFHTSETTSTSVSYPETHKFNLKPVLFHLVSIPQFLILYQNNMPSSDSAISTIRENRFHSKQHFLRNEIIIIHSLRMSVRPNILFLKGAYVT